MILELLKKPPIYYAGQHAFHILDASGQPVIFFNNHAYRLKLGQLQELAARGRGLYTRLMAVTICLGMTLPFNPPIWAILTGITALLLWGIWLTRNTYRDYPDFFHKEKPIDFYLPVWQRRLLIYWTRAINFEFSRHNIKLMLGSLLFWFLIYVLIVDESIPRIAAYGFVGALVVLLLPFYLSIITSCIYHLFLAKRGWRCQPDQG